MWGAAIMTSSKDTDISIDGGYAWCYWSLLGLVSGFYQMCTCQGFVVHDWLLHRGRQLT